MVNKIRKKLSFAIKLKNKEEILALRNILELIKKKQIDQKDNLTDLEIQNLLISYAKKIKESIKQFHEGNRLDLVEKEKNELEIVSKFLPQPLTHLEIESIVLDVINNLKANNMSFMGKVMSSVLQKTKGRADGKMISDLVKTHLNK